MTQITFGHGNYGVDTGTYGGQPAVFITPQKPSGPIGARVPRDQYELVRDSLYDGETVLLFPTIEQCRAVADALVGMTLAETDARDALTSQHHGRSE
jgi:hypothetical protein